MATTASVAAGTSKVHAESVHARRNVIAILLLLMELPNAWLTGTGSR